MILFYKNSFLASVVSILGCICVMVGVLEFDMLHTEELITVFAIGAALLIWGKKISADKSFKKWWKQVEDANLINAIRTDSNVAITIYQKNPCKATLKKIQELNPAAAELIAQSKAKK